MRFCIHRVIVIFIFSIVVVLSAGQNGDKPKSGPFRAILQKIITRCDQPFHPYESDPSLIPKFELYNTSTKVNLLRINVTVTKVMANILMKIKGYSNGNGEPRLIYYFNNVSCKSPILKAFMSISGAPYGTNTCRYPKGIITFTGIDVNSMEHLWMKTMEYGRMLWRVELYTRKETFICIEFDVIAEPA